MARSTSRACGTTSRSMAQHPFCALVAAGGTGELYSLSPAEHADVVRATVEAAGGRMPVIAGVGGSVAIAPRAGAARRRSAGAARHSGPAALLSARRRGRAARLLRGDRRRHRSRLLVYSRDWVNPGPAFVERLAERFADADRLEGRPGRHAPLPDRHARRRATACYWIGGAGDDLVGAYYRLGIRMLHVEHLERRARACRSRCTMSPPRGTSTSSPR